MDRSTGHWMIRKKFTELQAAFSRANANNTSLDKLSDRGPGDPVVQQLTEERRRQTANNEQQA